MKQTGNPERFPSSANTMISRRDQRRLAQAKGSLHLCSHSCLTRSAPCVGAFWPRAPWFGLS